MLGHELESTASLIRRVKDGEGEARETLVARCLPALTRWAHGRLPHYGRALAETDDLVQVTVMRALNNVEKFEPKREGAFLAYLRTILLNAVKDEIRRTSRRPTDEIDEEPVAKGPSALDRVVGDQTVASYERALESLPQTQRQAIILRIEFGMSYPEIALELEQSSANAVRMQVSRGLLKLAEAMG